MRRAIEIREREEVDESAFKALVRVAVVFNTSRKVKPSKKAKSSVDRHATFTNPRARCAVKGQIAPRSARFEKSARRRGSRHEGRTTLSPIS
jgi:hypothetical protein